MGQECEIYMPGPIQKSELQLHRHGRAYPHSTIKLTVDVHPIPLGYEQGDSHDKNSKTPEHQSDLAMTAGKCWKGVENIHVQHARMTGHEQQ